LTNDDMSPRGWQTIWSNADFNAMIVHRPVVTALHVVFACPDEFDWRAAQTLRDRSGLALNVRVGDGASAKTTAGHLGVKSDLFGFQSEHFCDRKVIERLKLRTSPRFGAFTVEAHGRIQRFHRRMSQKRKLVFRDNAIVRGDLVHRIRVAAINGDETGRAAELFVPGP